MNKLTGLEAREAFLNKEASAQEILQAHLDQIKKTDGEVNAFISLTEEEAHSQAQALDKALKEGRDPGPLAGMVISLKDNISLKGARMTCASKMLADYVPPYDAHVTTLLKEAGAMIIGKTNLDEFAMGSDTRTSYFGPTKNPLDLDLSAGGSSGGAAASVAGYMSHVAIATDTGGSIRQPAGYTGLYGIKPSYGSVSRFGIAPMAPSFDQAGVLARSSEDLAYVMELIEGRDPRDARSTGNPSLSKEAIGGAKDLKDLKVALPAFIDDYDLDLKVKAALDFMEDFLKSAGARVDRVDLKTLPHTVQAYYILINAEIASAMARYDGVAYGFRAEDFEDLDDLYIKTRSQGLGTEVKKRIIFGTYLTSQAEEGGYYAKAQALRAKMIEEFEALFNDYDLMLAPTSPVLGLKLGQELDSTQSYLADIFTPPVNLAGLAGVAVPVEKGERPIGIQLISAKYNDAQALRTARDYEREVKHGL